MTINPKWIFGHCAVVHDLAARTKQPGKLVITAFGEDPGRSNPKTGKPGVRLAPRVHHVGIGDRDAMVKHICEIADQPHYNVYMPLAVFRPDLPAGLKGGEEDIIACFGLVADFDDADAARWAERLPIPLNTCWRRAPDVFRPFTFSRSRCHSRS